MAIKTFQDLNVESIALGSFNFDAWLRSQGYSKTFNENFYEYLGALGYTQPTLNERWFAWKEADGSVGPVAPAADFDGSVFDASLFGSGDLAPIIEEDTNTSVQAPSGGYTVPFAVPELYIDPSTATGVYQYEMKVTNLPSITETVAGLADADYDSPGFPGRNLIGKSMCYQSSGEVYHQLAGSIVTDTAPVAYGNYTFVQVVLDCPAQEVRFYYEGVLQSTVSIAGVTFATGLRPVVGMAPNNRVHVEVDGFFAFPIAGATKWTDGLTVETPFNGLIFNKYTHNGSNTGYVISGANQEAFTNLDASGRIAFASNGLVKAQTGTGIYQCEFRQTNGTNVTSSVGFTDDTDELESAFRLGTNTFNSACLTRGGVFLYAYDVAGTGSSTGNPGYSTSSDYVQLVYDQNTQIASWYVNGVFSVSTDISAETFKNGIRPAAYTQQTGAFILDVTGPFNNTIAGATPWGA